MDFNKAMSVRRYRKQVIASADAIRNSLLRDEYYSKVRHNFSRYVFIMLRSQTMYVDEVIGLVSSYSGYECHREIRYQGDKTAHLYVRFTDCSSALDAALDIGQEPIYMTEILSTILENWYFMELSNEGLPWTFGVLDVVGNATNTDPLSKYEVTKVLSRFGYPRIFSFVNPQPLVQISFSSMAEALGACIVLGMWYRHSEPEDKCHYRLRIAPGSKEMNLLQHCIGAPGNEDFLQLDYFVPLDTTVVYAEENPHENSYVDDPHEGMSDSNAPQRRYPHREFRSSSSNDRVGHKQRVGRRCSSRSYNQTNLVQVPVQQMAFHQAHQYLEIAQNLISNVPVLDGSHQFSS